MGKKATGMTSDRWEEIQSIFEKALEYEGSERISFLDEYCGTDKELRKEVDTLLLALDDAGSFFDEPAAKIDALIQNEEAGLKEGEVIGSYRILRKLDSGGMGTVYLADRADDAFQREAAIKIVSKGKYNTAMKARFLEEQKILAKLEHPNIAQLYDAGVTKKGIPYLVMEYVEGVPVNDYCDENKLGVRERLELFRKILDAVHFAHQNLIIHQDIKPSNILVEANGEPKLLDFGIAKIIDATNKSSKKKDGEGEDELKHFLTPAYASPEQITGDPVTTGSDVYSLGILLYQLLSGHRPYEIKATRERSEIARVICEEEPSLPSTVVSKSQAWTSSTGETRTITPEQVSSLRGTDIAGLKRRLSGDLDHIVMMAVDKVPADRYLTALEFAHDIDRYLLGLPIQAHPASFTYAVQKFVRRNWVGVVATGTAFLIIGSILSQLVKGQAEIASKSNQLAETNTALERQTEATNQLVDEGSARLRFMESLFKYDDPNLVQGDTLTLVSFLGATREKIFNQLAAPKDKAVMLNQIAQLYEGLGVMAEAGATNQMALQVVEGELGSQTEEAARSTFILADFKMKSGEFTLADSLFGVSLDVRKKLAGEGGRSADVAQSLHGQGTVKRYLRNTVLAESLYREALEIRKEVFTTDHLDLVESNGDLGELLKEEERYPESEEFYSEAVSMARRLYGPNVRQNMYQLLDGYGHLLQLRAKYTEAESVLSESLDIRKKLFGNVHREVATGLLNLAQLNYDRGNYEKSDEYFQSALEMRKEMLGEEHPEVAEVINGIALVQAAKGDYEGAEALIRQSTSILFKAYETDFHPTVADARYQLALLLHVKGEYSRAEPEARKTQNIYNFLSDGKPTPEEAETLSLLGRILFRLGDTDSSEPIFRNALEMTEQLYGDTNLKVARALGDLAMLSLSRGENRRAEQHYQTELRIRKELQGPTNPGVAVTLSNLGSALMSQGRYAEAEEYLREELSIRKSGGGTADPDIVRSINSLSKVLVQQGNYAEAEDLLKQEVEMRSQLMGPDSPGVIQPLNDLATMLMQSRRYGDAEPYYRRVLESYRKTMPGGNLQLSFPLYGLGESLYRQGKTRSALPYIQEAVLIRRNGLPLGHQRTAQALSLLGGAYTRLGRLSSAEEVLLNAFEIFRTRSGLTAGSTQLAVRRLVTLYDRMDRPDEADRYRQYLPSAPNPTITNDSQELRVITPAPLGNN